MAEGASSATVLKSKL